MEKQFSLEIDQLFFLWFPIPYDPCMVYLPTFTIKINYKCRENTSPMDPSWVLNNSCNPPVLPRGHEPYKPPKKKLTKLPQTMAMVLWKKHKKIRKPEQKKMPPTKRPLKQYIYICSLQVLCHHF